MKSRLISFTLLFIISCKNYNNEIDKHENYVLTEKDISENCNAYQMFFYNDEYIFKFSLAGSCKNLKKEQYINEYSNYLNKYRNKLINRRGYIILDKIETNKNYKELQNSILTKTKSFVTIQPY